MTSLDDLRDTLDRYADRGEPRGAVAVLEAAQADAAGPPDDGRRGGARTRSGRWPARPVLVAIAAMVVLVVATLAVVRARNDEATVVTPGPAPAPSGADGGTEGADLRPIVVPDGRVDAVTVAFGRVWVMTTNPPQLGDRTGAHDLDGRVRSYDPSTGHELSDAPTYGSPIAFAASDHALWLRTTTNGPAAFPLPEGGQGDNVVYRIDPDSGATVDWVYLNGDGPLAASGDRMAAADVNHVVILGDTPGARLGDATIDLAVGVPNATFPGTNGITGLAFAPPDDPDGHPAALFAIHQGRGEVLALDPRTGRRQATVRSTGGTGVLGPGPTATRGSLWWAAPGQVVGATLNVFVPSDVDRPVPISGQVLELAGFGDDQVVIRMLDQAVVPRFAAEPGRVPGGNDGQTSVDQLVTHLDAEASGAIVMTGGQPWIAQWRGDDADPSTEITFVRVISEPTQPEGVPASPPAAVLTTMVTGPLHDGQVVPIAAAGLPANAQVVLQLCLVSDPDDGCVAPVTPDPLPVERVGNLAGAGELLSEWVAQRSLYDTRWHDCGLEACELRLYGLGDDGQPDRTRVLARAPLTFEESGPFIRPSLRRADGGAIHAGDTLTVLGEHFPPGATVRLRFCPTGPRTESCVDDGGEPSVVAEDGTVELRFTIPSTTLGPDGAVDCTSDRGVCMLAVFGDERSVETYAATLLDVVPVAVGTTPGTVAR